MHVSSGLTVICGCPQAHCAQEPAVVGVITRTYGPVIVRPHKLIFMQHSICLFDAQTQIWPHVPPSNSCAMCSPQPFRELASAAPGVLARSC